MDTRTRLAFLPTINRVPAIALGVTEFGQAGALEDVYRYHGIDTDSIVRAALDLSPWQNSAHRT